MNIISVGYNSVYGREYNFRREPEKNIFMLILAKSRAVFHIDDKEIHTPADTFILYDDTVICEYSADNGFFICDWICFDKDNDNEFFDSLELPFNRPVQFADTDFISNIMRNIATEYYSLSPRRIKMTDALMKTLLLKISDFSGRRDEQQQTVDPHYNALVELREKVYRNPQMKWNVDSMASDVNMSRSYFQHIYREMFGVSCISDVISGKIEKAKEILSETSCTVSQVSAMCGYDNEEHFMRQFKKIVGVTPTKYRRKI
ncbi:MAG: AraC family transcriptional regulator [Ruminococcus flavefaciens]|nr:AraC family transcriptional regulator [Ruminococcus flavefaciens]